MSSNTTAPNRDLWTEVLEVPAMIVTDEMGDGSCALGAYCEGDPKPVRIRFTVEADMLPLELLRIDGAWHFIFQDETRRGTLFGVKLGEGGHMSFAAAANLMSEHLEPLK